MDKISISSDLIRGHIDTIILHSLLSGDKFAQQISDVVKTKSDGKYEINQATLYSSLKRLEKLEYIKGYWHDSVGGRRRYFNLTESGKQYVEDNLTNWSFSRSIIDKLMDIEPQVETKTVIKEIEKPVEIFVSEPTVSLSNEQMAKPEKADNNAYSKNIDDKEVNYKAILSGLINYSNNVIEENIEIEPINAVDSEKISEKETVIKDFNEEISNNNNIKKFENYSNIDYTDIIDNAKNDDFCVRISSKKAIKTGKLIINKIKLFSSLSVFLFSILCVLITITAFNNDFIDKSFLPTILTLIALSILPITAVILFIKKPQKSVKSISGDSILISAIVVFNLLLITFAINMLFNANFYNTYTFIVSFVFPAILFIEIFLFYTLTFMFSKINKFKIKD